MNSTLPLNDRLVEMLCQAGTVDVAGSLYAVPANDRAAAAHLLSRRGLWIHADVFADAAMGVSMDLITELAEQGTGPIDVHLLTSDALNALERACRPGVARITFPYEGTDDVEAVSGRIRAVGAQPWLAVAPGTSIEDCRAALEHVDGLLVMLIPPGTKQSADLANLTKVDTGQMPRAGVDGGVHEDNVESILAAGSRYIVVGRRLFSRTGHEPEGGQQ